MTKQFRILALALVLVLSFSILVGCGKSECEHTWTDANCTTAKTCSKCGATEGAALGHTEVTVSAKAPTCTETGLTEGKKCSVCGEVIVAQNTVAALGHTEVSVSAKAPTCTETGLTEGKKCSVCDAVTVAQNTVAALGHKDENKDHVCDNGCGVAQGECVDADKDHACDYGCGETFGDHADVDTDTDHVCDYGCGVEIGGHVYGEWTTVTEPTYDAEGLEKQTCNCGDVKEQAIPKLIPVAGIIFEKELHNIVLGVNDTVTLNVTIFPDNASNKNLTWTSTDDSVASVVDGVITGHKEGFVNVIATDDRGLVSTMAYIYVTSTAIDGAITDELYADSIPSYSSKEGRDQVTKVVLSEGGFYLVYDVTDPDIVTDSHLELYLSFGNSPKEIGKAFELRYYPLRDDLPNGAAYAWNGSEWAGITNTFRMYSKTVPVTDADDKITGYISETFVPYSSVGLDEAPEYLELLSVQFYWLNDSMHCGHGGEVWFFLSHLDNFDYFKQYNKDGYVDDVFVEVDFNGGKIENSGSSTDASVGAYLPGGGTGNKNSTEFIPADNVTFVNGVDGAENGAISSKHYSGPYTVVDGVTLGTADFTVSTWINIPEDAILSTGNQTFIFGTKPADSSRTDGFFCTIRKTTDGSYTIIVNAAEKGSQWLQNVNFKQGEWNLITLVRKSDELRFYLNDQLLHTWYFSNQDFGAYDIVFGGQLGEAWPYMDQVMIFDNVRIYKRALAINELTEICKNDVAK